MLTLSFTVQPDPMMQAEQLLVSVTAQKSFWSCPDFSKKLEENSELKWWDLPTKPPRPSKNASLICRTNKKNRFYGFVSSIVSFSKYSYFIFPQEHQNMLVISTLLFAMVLQLCYTAQNTETLKSFFFLPSLTLTKLSELKLNAGPGNSNISHYPMRFFSY